MAAPLAAALALTALLWLATSSTTLRKDAVPSPTPTETTVSGVAAMATQTGWLCPPRAPVAAYGSPLGYHYFPLSHPRHLDPSVRPTRCYRAPAEAESAGFTRGLLPQGWFELDGVFIGPIADIGREDAWLRMCERTTAALGFAVPCPHLVPPTGVSGRPRCGTGFPSNPGCIYRAGRSNAFYLQYQSFAGPNGLPTGGWGLTIAAFGASDAGPGSSFEQLFLCGGTEPSRRMDLAFAYEEGTSRGQVIDCTDGIPPSDGQLLLAWKREGAVYVIGIPRNLELHEPGLLEQLAVFISCAQPG